MAKIKVNDTNVSLTLNYSLAQLKEVAAKYPAALRIEKDDEFIYAICAGDESSITKYGATFATETALTHKAAITFPIVGNNAEEIKANIVERFGTEVVHISTIETKIAIALRQIEADKAAVLALIDGLE